MYLINAHLLICEKIVNKNYEHLTGIRTILNKHEIYDYEVDDFFKDFGLKKFVQRIRKRIEDLGK